MSAVTRRMLDQKIADGRRDRAVTTLGWQLDKHVLPYFHNERDVRTIRRADLEGFKAHLRTKGMAAQTINNLLTAVRQVLKHAHRVDELLETVPEVANVATDKNPKWRLLTADELKRLFDALDPRAVEAKHFLLFLANTGLRKSEALAVRHSWIDYPERRLVIPPEFNKGGRARPAVYLNDVAMAVLSERKRNPPARATDPDRVFLQLKHDAARNSAAKRAKLGRVRNHDLRHSFASLAHASGASLVEVADMLGHTTLAMVRQYGHSFEERRRELAGRVQVGAEFVPGAVSDERSTTGKKGSKAAQSKSAASRKSQ